MKNDTAPSPKQPEKTPIRVFLSYAHDDKNLVNKMLALLKPHLNADPDFCFSTWQDNQILPGEKWDAEIGSKLADCNIGFFMASASFCASNYIISKELRHFKDTDKPFILIGANKCDLKILNQDGLAAHQIFLLPARAGGKGRWFSELTTDPGKSEFGFQLAKQITERCQKLRKGDMTNKIPVGQHPSQQPAGINRSAGGADSDFVDSVEIEEEVAEFLKSQHLTRAFYGQFIEIISSPECRGWTREEVSHKYVGEYCPNEAMRSLMARFPVTPPNRGYFGLRKCPALGFADARGPAQFELCGGNWHHVSVLSKVFKTRLSDPDCGQFRKDIEQSWINYDESAPLGTSTLYHNVNAETLLVTSDWKLVLGKRNGNMIAGGAWSASLEEQMLREDQDKPSRNDKHLFDAAERGVREEIGVQPISDATRLLRVGVEWGNFTAAFIFLVRCAETYEEVVRIWSAATHDPYEAVALDCIGLSQRELKSALAEPVYFPSENFRQRVTVNRRDGAWHPTSRARIKALIDHLAWLNEE